MKFYDKCIIGHHNYKDSSMFPKSLIYMNNNLGSYVISKHQQ